MIRIKHDHALFFLGLVTLVVTALAGCSGTNSVVSNRDALQEEKEGKGPPAGTAPQNAAPVLNLMSSKAIVGYGGEVVLTADAMDPDGDLLKFAWTASEGVFINQTGNRATWKAPDHAISAEITCQARDAKGAANAARTQVDVVGGRKYRLNLALNRSSLYANATADTPGSEWVPLSQAKVTLPGLSQVGISDRAGGVEFDVDSGAVLASQTEVVVQYLDWEARYRVTFPNSGRSVTDSLQFFPGYDGVTVAVGRGDSFLTQRGSVEVLVVEQTNGETRPMTEVTVQVGAGQQTARDGIAFLSSELPGGQEAPLRITKAGYQPLAGYRIPIFVDGLTIVRARLVADSAAPRTEAIVSWTRPFKEQRAVPVTGPFEIGFGQPMEKATIFDDLEMVMQEGGTHSTIILRGADLARFFAQEWEGNTVLRLTPRTPLRPLRKYNFSVTRWTAHATDGRVLKNYSGMFGAFTTDTDANPVIASTIPRNGDSGVARSGPFMIRFDRPMDTATLKNDLLIEITQVDSGSVVRVDGSSLEGKFSVQWREDDTLLSLVPRRELLASTPYLVKLIRSGLRSRSGRGVEMLSNLWGQFSTGEL